MFTENSTVGCCYDPVCKSVYGRFDFKNGLFGSKTFKKIYSLILVHGRLATIMVKKCWISIFLKNMQSEPSFDPKFNADQEFYNFMGSEMKWI